MQIKKTVRFAPTVFYTQLKDEIPYPLMGVKSPVPPKGSLSSSSLLSSNGRGGGDEGLVAPIFGKGGGGPISDESSGLAPVLDAGGLLVVGKGGGGPISYESSGFAPVGDIGGLATAVEPIS